MGGRKDLVERSEYNQDYYEKHKTELLPKIRKRTKIWQASQREHCNEYQRDSRKENPAPWREVTRRYRAKLKADGIAAYGGCCQCCGETELDFLTCDHVKGGGNKHRAELKKQGQFGGGGMWLVAKKEKYPPTYRVLCWNCQWGARLHNGVCTHKLNETSDQNR